MQEQVRSGRSPHEQDGRPDERRPDEAGSDPQDAAGVGGRDEATRGVTAAGDAVSTVVVLGRGPVAAAVAAQWDRRGRVVEELPDRRPTTALAGAEVLVLVAHPAELVAPSREGVAAAAAGAQHALAAARAAGVRHVVVVTSAMVHGAWPDRPVVRDDEPLLAGDDAPREGVVAELLAVEAVLATVRRRRRPALTVLRPAPVVGQGMDTLVTRHFEAPRLLTLRGVQREWQLVHVEDVASAVRFVVEHGLTGALTVGPPDVLTAGQVEAAAGMRHVELAAATAFGTAERLHRVGVLPAPAAELAYTVYPWTVAADRLRQAGWEPRWSTAECLDVLLEGVQGRLAVAGRRVGARDAAALGAAGAAVALIGTAAVWRQARSRRGR